LFFLGQHHFILHSHIYSLPYILYRLVYVRDSENSVFLFPESNKKPSCVHAHSFFLSRTHTHAHVN
jgi:hypothetical protein